MSVYFVTGKLGAGKTLCAVGRIRDYLLKGRLVATNLDINIDKMIRRESNHFYYRLPDKPTVEDLDHLPSGNESYDESLNGLLVFDECGTWFNSRNWNDKGRKALIDWFLHARKKGWDIIFIVQDISIVDKQARDSLCEMLVTCKRLDRFKVPFIGSFFKLFGVTLNGPRIHTARVLYGDNVQGMKIDRWTYRGTDLYAAYDTKQCFTDSGPGLYCSLSPFLLFGRYEQRPSFLNSFLSSFFRLLFFVSYPFYCFLKHLYPSAQHRDIDESGNLKSRFVGYSRSSKPAPKIWPE